MGGIRFINPKPVKTEIVRNTISGRSRSTQIYNSYRSNRDLTALKNRNNWIPLEAYKCAMDLGNKYNLDFTNIEIEQLLIAFK